MNLSEGFINRPIAIALLMVAVVALGIVSYLELPVAALPNIDSPTIQVTAQLPGADPETMASSVATQLERQFGEIPLPSGPMRWICGISFSGQRVAPKYAWCRFEAGLTIWM